jgi:hypothetical protein
MVSSERHCAPHRLLHKMGIIYLLAINRKHSDFQLQTTRQSQIGTASDFVELVVPLQLVVFTPPLRHSHLPRYGFFLFHRHRSFHSLHHRIAQRHCVLQYLSMSDCWILCQSCQAAPQVPHPQSQPARYKQCCYCTRQTRRRSQEAALSVR